MEKRTAQTKKENGASPMEKKKKKKKKEVCNRWWFSLRAHLSTHDSTISGSRKPQFLTTFVQVAGANPSKMRKVWIPAATL